MALIKLKERVIEAFAATNNIKKFPELVGELTVHFSKNWAVGSYKEALESLNRGSLDNVEFVLVCVDSESEADLEPILGFIAGVKKRNLTVILIADDINPMSMHQLMRQGADDFIPCPLPKDALGDSIVRMRTKHANDLSAPKAKRTRRKGMVFPVYGVAGGVGTTTFAVNLAWELATFDKKSTTKVAILDLNLQTGSVATYLDLGRRESVAEMLSNIDSIDTEMFAQSLTSFKSQLAVMSAPPEIMPLDILSGEDVINLIGFAKESYDYIIIDMPTTLVNWSAEVLQLAETYFTIMELDMRSAQNMMRFLRALQAEDLPEDKLQFVLNYAPAFTDLNGKARAKRFSESLGIEMNILLPDGGKPVLAACDHGTPLADAAGKNALRKEIRKIAASIIQMADAHVAAVV